MKTFLKWSWIPAICIVVLPLIILLILWQPPKEEEEDFFVTQSYYVDSTVADSDERLTSAYVNNSATNFFVQGDQPERRAIHRARCGAAVFLWRGVRCTRSCLFCFFLFAQNGLETDHKRSQLFHFFIGEFGSQPFQKFAV